MLESAADAKELDRLIAVCLGWRIVYSLLERAFQSMEERVGQGQKSEIIPNRVDNGKFPVFAINRNYS